MMFKYRVPLLFFWFLVIITLYMIKSKYWKLNFSRNYQPDLPSSQNSGQDWKPNFRSAVFTKIRPGHKTVFCHRYQPVCCKDIALCKKVRPVNIHGGSCKELKLLKEITAIFKRALNTHQQDLDCPFMLYVYYNVDYIPSKEELAGATADQLVSIYHSYLDNVDYLCHRKFRMGKIGDGGWEICDDFEYRPIEPCTIFSFGINFDFSFDDDASALYGCQVYSFDPSMKKSVTHRHTEKVYFYKIGIRGENDFNRTENWEMMTFSGICAMLNYSKKIIDVVKMDVEGSEWDSLILMAKEGLLQNIRQLLIEYHFAINRTKYSALIYRLNVLRLVEDHGFRRFYVHKNPVCGMRIGQFPLVRTYCYETHYVNTLLKRPKNNTR